MENNTKKRIQINPSFIIRTVAIAFSIFHLCAASMVTLNAFVQRSIHLTFALVLVLLIHPYKKEKENKALQVVNLIMVMAAIVVGIYAGISYETMSDRAGEPSQLDIICGVLTILLLLEATRRTLGKALPTIASICTLYMLFGYLLPSTIGHTGFSVNRIIYHLYMTTEGIFGVPLGVSASYIILFTIFGAIMIQTGGSKFISDLAFALFGKYRGGPAKAAVVSSAAMGTISGAAVASVATVGIFTIPLMKKVGYSDKMAAAIEAVASTGAQLTPPVMGAAAFIMAELLQMPYATIIVAAAIPAFLYYQALFLTVDLEAAKCNLHGIPKDQLPDVKEVLKHGWFQAVPVFVLIGYIVFLHTTPAKAAIAAIITAILVSFLSKENKMTLPKFFTALDNGARTALDIAMATATAGIIVGSFTLSGLGMKLASLLIALSQGNLLLLLLITMVVSLILGMGMTTTDCYIILAVLVAPALIRMGVHPIAAHLFVFYFGIVSAITPPVALAAQASAGIAGADFMKTGFLAMRLGLVAFILPYLFVYNPVLLMEGSVPDILTSFLTAAVGITGFASALNGYLFTFMRVWSRIVLFFGGILMIVPGWQTDLIGFFILLLIGIMQYYKAKKTTGNLGLGA